MKNNVHTNYTMAKRTLRYLYLESDDADADAKGQEVLWDPTTFKVFTYVAPHRMIGVLDCCTGKLQPSKP